MATKTIAPAAIYDNRIHARATDLVRQKRFGELSYTDLQQICIYDPGGAEQAAVLREQARAQAKAAEAAPPAQAQTPAPEPLHAGRFHEVREKFADYVMGTDEAGEPWLDIACAHPQTAVPLWMFAGLAGATLKAINEKNKLRNEKIADLTARLAALEARPPALKWAGPWKPGETYQAGDAVADRGVWICTEPTAMRPGESRAWQLAIKPARDGKDAPR